jgi:antitoxin component YwqK of YwqJK toxin-antitoxin module
MKKLIIALSVLVISGAAMAQTKTTFYPNGQKQAEGTLLNADATVLSKDFESLPKETQMQKMQNCVKDGKWTMWYENGATYSEQFYKNGLMTGVWKNYQPDGSVADIIDFENGKASYFHKNGKVQSEGKISGQMGQEGKWILYYENGQVNAEGNYINGKKDGVWTWYDVKGKKTDEQTYQNGTISGHKRF